MNNDNILDINNLRIYIKTKTKIIYPVNGLSLKIKSGQTLALIGESGCGKSMTANAIMQLLPPNTYYGKDSHILLNNDDLINKSEAMMRQIRGNSIAMIFQDPMTALNPVFTIGEQISEVFKNNNKPLVSNIKDKVLNILHEVGMPSPLHQFDAYPHQLSGGMRQRAVIAIALAAKPKLLIADEPTTALDVTIQRQILELLKEIQIKYQMSLLLITHNMSVVKQIADHVAVMYAGYIIEEASTDEIITNPRHPYTKMLLRAQPSLENKTHQLSVIKGFVPSLDREFNLCRFKDRCPVSELKCSNEEPILESMQENQKHLARCFYQDKSIDYSVLLRKQNSDNENDNLLQINNLKVTFPIYKGLIKRAVDSITVVNNVSFELKSGKTLALVGESGCGKSTIAKAIMGLLDYDGNIEHKGNLMQIIFQDPYSALDPKMMIADILQEGSKAIYNKYLNERKLIELLATVGLPENALYRYPHEFSGGQRQRIAIARALAVKPKILILDEPTSALDLSVQAQILNLLKDLQYSYNLTYLFITHDLAVVAYMADFIAVMRAGEIVEYGIIEQIMQKPMHSYTKKLLESV
jgi:peptide/nickel transport system ATP-binding protein